MADNAPTSASTLTNGSTTTIEPTSAAQTYDILPKLIPHLDRHLIFPLLDALPASEGTKAKYELLKQTNMAQYLLSLWQEMNDSDDTPAEFTKKQEKVSETYDTLAEQTSALSALLDDESVISNFRADKVANLRYLEENHGVNVEQVDKLYEFGRFNYSCGNYGAAALQLGQFRILSTDNDKVSAATWGKLACDILSANWEDVMEEINKVRESIDTKLFNNPLSQLENRTWLIHWALFPLFNYEPAREVLTDILFTPNFINTIQTNCPWILRYLAAAVINNRNKAKNSGVYQKQVKDLTRAIRQELYEYRDPITDFIIALNVDFDFEEAQKKLVEAEKLMQGDFFLSPSTEMFIESARHLISESYCRIHQRIDIKDLSARLGLGQDEGEKWIVNLIRDTRVDAKIDYKEGTVVMNHPPQSVYQQIIERTKGIQFRTALLSQSVSS